VGDARPGDPADEVGLGKTIEAGLVASELRLRGLAARALILVPVGLVTASAWDLVIVDEAHRVKNPQSASAKLVRALRTRYLLLLTATPVENRLDDLIQLVNLVRPGHLGTPREFRARHGSTRTGAEPARNLATLQARLREVMVRHRRSKLASMLPRRLAETLCLQPGAEEAELYASVSHRIHPRCSP
jgi:SNF2 family DNA or RNA helicase